MLPEKFLERMEKLLSESEYQDFKKAFDNDDERHHALRVNRQKAGDDQAVLQGLLAFGDDKTGREDSLESVPWEDRGYYYEEELAPGKHPYHEAGLYYIQEPSAMAPVSFLDVIPGDRVLDLCAAPGGKSTQSGDCLKGEGLLVTNEINRERAKILSQNIERMGIKNAMVLNEDSEHLSSVFGGFFDRILVDAPCSGEGMFRKNEAALTEWSPENVQLCAKRQSEILKNAACMLAPGGRLVYSTCTFSPEENEETIFKFLLQNGDFHVVEVPFVGGMEHGRKEWVDTGKCLAQTNEAFETSAVEKALLEVEKSVRLWPGKVRGEGHFLCALQRDGRAEDSGSRTFVPGGRNVPVKKEVAAAFGSFAKENLNIYLGDDLDERNLLAFGDQLYLTPPNMPGVKGLKVLRPGLHLGTIKKDRFEPSHALALSLKAGEAKLVADFSSGSDEIRQFLNGQTLRLSGSLAEKLSGRKGWCLIACDGYSIGWAKLSGGLCKNHYPKGLRINY